MNTFLQKRNSLRHFKNHLFQWEEGIQPLSSVAGQCSRAEKCQRLPAQWNSEEEEEEEDISWVRHAEIMSRAAVSRGPS